MSARMAGLRTSCAGQRLPTAPMLLGACLRYSKLFSLCLMGSFLQERQKEIHHPDYDCSLPKAFYLNKWAFFSIFKFLTAIILSLIVSNACFFSLQTSVTNNPWVRLATVMLTRCTTENKEGLGNEVLKLCRSLYNTEQMLPAEVSGCFKWLCWGSSLSFPTSLLEAVSATVLG